MQIVADVIKPFFKDIFEQRVQFVSIISCSVCLFLVSQLIYVDLFEFDCGCSLFDDFELTLLFFNIVSCFSTIFILFLGVLTGSHYSLMGSLRSYISEISIEIIFSLNTAILVEIGNTFDLEALLLAQNNVAFLFCLFFLSVCNFFVTFIAAQRSPVDLIEVEGELVAGYNLEFSGADVLIIYFAEYFHLVNGSLQFVTLLIGCYNFSMTLFLI